MLHFSPLCTLKASSARPTPGVPPTAIAHTLCLATVVYCVRAHARFLVALCRTKRRSALPRRLRSRGINFLILFLLLSMILISLSPFLPLNLSSPRRVQPSHPASPRPSSVARTNLAGSHGLLFSLPLSAAVHQCWRQAAGTNRLAYGFK